jgi:hypothetical protein
MKKFAITAIAIFASIIVFSGSKQENTKNLIGIRLHATMHDNRKDIGSAD